MEVPDLERHLILETIARKYGYDFRGYARASLDRRLRAVLTRHRLPDAAELLAVLLRDDSFFPRILPELTIGTTEMFRDPGFFRTLREKVVPHLMTYPSVNIWVAGCSTGQEAYSVAILLKECGLYDRSVIFATDINPAALNAAKEGIFSAEAVKTYTKNYQDAGGREAFSDYYTADYGYVRMSSELREKMVFSEHNLVTDQSFTEAHLVLCRNVLIYFDRELQDRALSVMRDSLVYRGFLALGSKESLRFSSVASSFEPVDAQHKVYQRISRVVS